MASGKKNLRRLVRQLFQLSVTDGAVSAERVAGVLAYVDQHHPAQARRLLQAYHRLIAAELARSHAVVEHAGSIAEATIPAIAAAMSVKYRRPISASPAKNDALLAGLRIRVGDDTYESSVAAQLTALAAAV